MDREEKPRFTLIRGGGEAGGAVRRSFVAVDTTTTHGDRPARGGHGAAPEPAACLVSLGLDGLDLHEFHRILKLVAIRHIVDTRILAAFRSNGFRLHLVERMFDELRIEYDRAHDLANPFSTGGIGAPAELKKYAEHLRGHSETLRDIGRRAAHAPLLLLGHAAAHQGTEREVIAQEMARLGISFRLLVVRKQESAIHVVTWPGVTVAEEPAAPLPAAHRGRSRKTKAADAQVLLPFSSGFELERQQK